MTTAIGIFQRIPYSLQGFTDGILNVCYYFLKIQVGPKEEIMSKIPTLRMGLQPSSLF